VAELVGGFGVPHNPHFPTWVEEGHPLAAEIERMYGEVASRLEAAEPDAVVFVTSDHYNMFWEILPLFALAVADSARGASDYPTIAPRELPIDRELAGFLQERLVRADFDVARLQEVELDHTVVEPMQFLAPGRDLALVPVFVNVFLRPLPSARRCFALGRAIRGAVEAFPEPRRVAVVASGSFSLEIGGPRIAEDSHTGVPDPGWLGRVVELLRAGELDRLVEEATDERLDRAGNAGGELLDWLVMLGTIDAAPAAHVDVQPQFGHAYASWPREAV
jgi:Catalytic LigB subunit of aromatic ring-opening dioxygenase